MNAANAGNDGLGGGTKASDKASGNVNFDLRRCDMALGMMEQGWFGEMALKLVDPDNKVDDKAYLHSFLRHVVTHEMGHIMGLRHNFIASTHLDSKQLADEKTIEKQGIAASVMDYTPFNVFALKHKGVDFYQPGLGPYDAWAIEYGYTSLDGLTPQGDVAKLQHIASRCNEPGLAYESDEDADSFDPAVVRFDLGKNPLDYYQKTLEVSRHMLLHLGDRVPRLGESYYTFTQDFGQLLGQYVRASSLAARYVGGLHINRNFKGDPNEKPTLAPIVAEDQKRGLQLMNTYILSEDAFTLPRSYYTHMTSDPNGGTGASDFPLRDTFARIQRSALARLFNPLVLNRIVNNEFKVGDPSKSLTLPYLFHSVGATVWSELDAHKNIGTLHRQLQGTYVDLLIAMATTPNSTAPEDAKLLAWNQLRQLKSRISQTLASSSSSGNSGNSGTGVKVVKVVKMDEYTRIHLSETLTRINRILEARTTIAG